jgi:predicted nucleotidyltransferase
MSDDARPATVVDDRAHARDAHGTELDLRPLQMLLTRIEEKYHAEQVWLFGGRARGDAGPSSDWDLFVVVPDQTDEHDLDPRVPARAPRPIR